MDPEADTRASKPETDPYVGRTIDGYRIDGVIGRGGMGVVYKALDERKKEANDRNPYVAMKVLNDEFKQHPESLMALQREARKAQDLAHPNIVNVFDFDRDGDTVFMTMEYLEGEPLDEVIKRNAMTGLSWQEARPIIRGMTLALAYAHDKGIVHSDFKPGNCFLTKEGVVKVFDFGIARAAQHADDVEGEKTLFDAGTLGALTPAYASCEMLEGQEPDQRDDIYALACTAYELLAGKHPFNKLSAVQARDNALSAAPLKKVGRAANKAIVRGLAFQRGERTESAQAFLNEVLPKKAQRGLLIGASAAAAVLLAVLGVVVIPPYLKNKRIEALIDGLQSGDDARIASVLSEVTGMPPADQTTVFTNTRSNVIDYYERRIREVANAPAGLYDYPAAQAFIGEMRRLFPDSSQVEGIASTIDTERRQAILAQTNRYNDALENGRLLPEDGADHIGSAIEVIRQVAPDSGLLTDPRLAGAYATEAQRAIDSDQLPRAETLLVAGLEAVPDEAQLVNLLDSVRAEQRKIRNAMRLAELEGTITGQLPGLDALEDFEAVRTAMRDLADIDPESTTLADARSALTRRLDTALAERRGAYAWSDAEDLLASYAPVLSDTYTQQARARIDSDRDAHVQLIDGLQRQLSEALSADRLDGPQTPNARGILEKLDASGADADALELARGTVAQAYLARARDARSSGEFDQARAEIDAAQTLGVGEVLARSLQTERQRIDQAELSRQADLEAADRQRLEAERLARVDDYRNEFVTGLQDEQFDTADAARLLDVYENLRVDSPDDELVRSGRDQIARRLASEADAMAESSGTEAALAFAQQAKQVLPDAEVLTETITRLTRVRAEAERQGQLDRVRARKDRVRTLLASPAYDDRWDSALREELQQLSLDLPADDPELEAFREQIARQYLTEATQRRLEQRFTEASSLLDRGERFAGDLPEIRRERETLADARSEFDAAQEQQQRLAAIEGNKQTFIAQAGADSVTKARETLALLAESLPADDDFLVSTAPAALGAAYERLARRAAERGDFDRAVTFADAGLEIDAGRVSLREARTNYQRQGNLAAVRRTLGQGSAGAVRDLAPRVAQIRDAENDYAALEGEFAETLTQRLGRLQASDYEAAEQLKAAGISLFPGNARIAGFELTRPTVAATPPPDETPVTPTVATPPPEVTIPPVSSTPPATRVALGEDPCKASLAGFGGRGRRGTCRDGLPGGDSGPDLVVIPAGSGMPVFAITRYEVKVDEFNTFCRITGNCLVRDGVDGNLPVTAVSATDAEGYAAWLADTTGRDYRLPTRGEWVYAAGGGGKPGGDFNCESRDARGTLIRGYGLLPVNSGNRNGWGLYNPIGNAQEIVLNQGSYEAIGGAYSDSLSRCGVDLAKAHTGADDQTGFRVVRKIEGGG